VEVTDYVLENFSKDEMKQLEGVFQVAADAVVTIITKGVKQGMNQFNNRSKLIFC
jgi:peptidyl-tRNA hydrolase